MSALFPDVLPVDAYRSMVGVPMIGVIYEHLQPADRRAAMKQAVTARAKGVARSGE